LTHKEVLQTAAGDCILRFVAQHRTITPGYVVIYPNRDRAASHATKAVVVLLLLVSAALMLAVTFGGWSNLQGMKPVNFLWIIVYLVMAFYISRWARGLLPIAAALAILLLIVSLIATFGASGTSWFQRSHFGYAPSRSIFGTAGMSADFLGLLTLLLAPVQALLILFCMRAFQQAWNVELEVPREEAQRRRGAQRPPSAPASPAAA
jgi:hypothetical protein